MTKIPILLNDQTITALSVLAKQEYRDIRQQAAVMIRDALVDRGLIKKQGLSGQLSEPIQRQQKAKA